MYFSFIMFMVLFILTYRAMNDASVNLCANATFILPRTFNCFISVIFIVVGVQIARSINEISRHQMEAFRDNDDEKMTKTIKNQVSTRNKALFRMWLIIVTTATLAVWALTYSSFVFSHADE